MGSTTIGPPAAKQAYVLLSVSVRGTTENFIHHFKRRFRTAKAKGSEVQISAFEEGINAKTANRQNQGQSLNTDIYAPTRKEEYEKSEEPAIILLKQLGYVYKNQTNLNKERKDFREVLLYDRLKAAIEKLNPVFDEDGIYDALSKINESNFPYTYDIMDTNEKIRAKLIGLSRSGGLEPITVTQNLGSGKEERTVRFFDFDNPENNDFLVTNQWHNLTT